MTFSDQFGNFIEKRLSGLIIVYYFDSIEQDQKTQVVGLVCPAIQ